MTTDPAKGDTIRWTEQRNGRKRTYVGTVERAHPDRWLVKVGPGNLHSLTRPNWAATGVVVEPATAARPRLVLVSG